MIIPLAIGTMAGGHMGWLSLAVSAWKAETAAERNIWIKAAVIAFVGLILLVFVPGVLAVAGLVTQWVYWVGLAAYFAGFTLLILWTRSRLRPIRGSCSGQRCP